MYRVSQTIHCSEEPLACFQQVRRQYLSQIESEWAGSASACIRHVASRVSTFCGASSSFAIACHLFSTRYIRVVRPWRTSGLTVLDGDMCINQSCHQHRSSA